MTENILTTAVKIAKIVDDNVERDESLSKIAQMQAAANCPADALETISQIRLVDIRADAIRKSLDNLLTRFNFNKEPMPNLDVWLEKLMEETLAVPNSRNRCPKLNSIILFILPRLDNKETALDILRQARNEFDLLDNAFDRSKYLFSTCEMFQQLNCNDEASTALELIQDSIAEIDSTIQQGLALGILAGEFWKMQDYMSAFECIGRIENRSVQSYAYLQLVEMLTVAGKFNDAEKIIEQLEDKQQKNTGEMFIRMGKFIFRSFPKDMKNIVMNINKSFVFDKDSDDEDSEDSPHSQNSSHFAKPHWINHILVIKPFENVKDEPLESDPEKEKKRESNIIQENRIESYTQVVDSDEDSDEDDVSEPWKDSDEDDVSEPWKESDDDDVSEPWNESDEDDDNEPWKESDEDDDNEPWKESDEDDDNEPWKESDEDDDSEPWNESDDEDGEPWDESEDNSDNNDINNIGDIINKLQNNENDDNADNNGKISKELWKQIHDFIKKRLKFAHKINHFKKLHEEIFEKILNNHNNLNLSELPPDKYYSLMETSQGIVLFNQPMPPELLQQLLRKIFKVFHSASRNREQGYSHNKEKIEDYISRLEEIGFDQAWQEVISQGDYQFAVECALNSFFFKNKDNLFFGSEYLF